MWLKLRLIKGLTLNKFIIYPLGSIPEDVSLDRKSPFPLTMDLIGEIPVLKREVFCVCVEPERPGP